MPSFTDSRTGLWLTKKVNCIGKYRRHNNHCGSGHCCNCDIPNMEVRSFSNNTCAHFDGYGRHVPAYKRGNIAEMSTANWERIVVYGLLSVVGRYWTVWERPWERCGFLVVWNETCLWREVVSWTYREWSVTVAVVTHLKKKSKS